MLLLHRTTHICILPMSRFSIRMEERKKCRAQMKNGTGVQTINHANDRFSDVIENLYPTRVSSIVDDHAVT